MKINPLQDEAAASPAGASKAATGAKPAAPAAAQATTGTAAAAQADGVKVTVSPLARSLEPVSAGAGIDAERVREMRDAIEKGTFKVDADKIADALLQDAQEILSRVRR